MRRLQNYAIGLLFVGSGLLHFRNPRVYERIVPPFLPAHREIVIVSGIFEVLGGLGVLPRQTRVAAGWGLVALLIAVFPANLYMAVDAAKFAKFAPAWALYARLPLQFAFIVWVYYTCIKPELD